MYICNMIKRDAEKGLTGLAGQFKAVAVTGPRQSGKTTLTRYVFADRAYVSLENPDNRRFAMEDPVGFLKTYKKGGIIDEIQKVPELFSYFQQILDEQQEAGKFIFTGSNNFLLKENISQSLAGRIAYLTLLPFSYDEIKDYFTGTLEELLFQGGYPPVYDQPVDPHTWLANYINTYVERDVRQIRNISNLSLFERFLKLCAGRTGQLLNMNNLAIETGVDHKTVASWLSILESSYIIYRLRPYYRSFNKRLVKMHKLYFYDTGLVCSLLGIQDPAQLILHPLAGSLFENFVVSEFLKMKYHRNVPFDLYFWRDNAGHEIDLLLEISGSMFPVEIKSGKTVTSEYFKNLLYWKKLTGAEKAAIIYAGDEIQYRSDGITVVPWKETGKVGGMMNGSNK